jgi:diguanylate cyclase (GGDEF)-like protein
MRKEKILYFGGILLIASEVLLITFLGYAVAHYLPVETGRYVSLDVFYCLPVIQTARLAAIHATRRSDTQTSTFVGIVLASGWSATEAVLAWPFPTYAFLLNIFTRSVVFTVLGRVLVKLWREREYAHKDMLTGLASRLELLKRLEAEQERSARSGRPYSVLFIDIDSFKALNDSFGHRIGDEALKTLADILRRSTRNVDVVARLGGDEFVVLLPDTDKPSCDIVITRIEESSEQIFHERFWPISVSIGRATQIGKTQEVDWVVRLADENMYEVKRMKQQKLDGAYGRSI